ncbi:MAG: hypothetical protein HQL67_04355 [Magnetococcales bacterium]|nr:hypothetical protein [Magnetococcales bacterium]
MRPIVFFLFFMIFSAAALVWIMNDPEMESWKEGPLSAFVTLFTGQSVGNGESGVANPADEKPVSRAELKQLERRITQLQSQLAQTRNNVKETLSTGDPRLDNLELAVTAHENRLQLQNQRQEQLGMEISTLRSVVGIRVETGVFVAAKMDKNWKLSNMFSKKRVLEQRVAFLTSFSSPPKILLSISGLELSNERGRISTTPIDIEEGGFTLQIESKSDTRVGEVSVSWAAFGL